MGTSPTILDSGEIMEKEGTEGGKKKLKGDGKTGKKTGGRATVNGGKGWKRGFT